MDSGLTAPCPVCREPINPDARKCRFCLEPLTEGWATASAADRGRSVASTPVPLRVKIEGPAPYGGVGAGVAWMLCISLLLFFLPMLGPFIGGLVGGRKSGSASNAILAALVPSLLFATALLGLTSFLADIPIIGSIVTMGTIAVAFAGGGPLLLGAIIGGAFAPPGGVQVSRPALALVAAFSILLTVHIGMQVRSTVRLVKDPIGTVESAISGATAAGQSGPTLTQGLSGPEALVIARRIGAGINGWAIDHGYAYPTLTTLADARRELGGTYLSLDELPDGFEIQSGPEGWKVRTPDGQVVSEGEVD